MIIYMLATCTSFFSSFFLSVSLSLSLSLSLCVCVCVCAVYAAIVSKYERLMGSIVATDMDFNQLDEFLKAQMKKKEARLVVFVES